MLVYRSLCPSPFFFLSSAWSSNAELIANSLNLVSAVCLHSAVSTNYTFSEFTRWMFGSEIEASSEQAGQRLHIASHIQGFLRTTIDRFSQSDLKGLLLQGGALRWGSSLDQLLRLSFRVQTRWKLMRMTPAMMNTELKKSLWESIRPADFHFAMLLEREKEVSFQHRSQCLLTIIAFIV